MNKFAPIFNHEENMFFVPHLDWVADTDDDAHKIGWGASFVEGIVLDFKFEKVQEIDSNNISHIKTQLQGRGMAMDVCLIAGPMFDEMSNEQKTPSP